MLMLSVLSVAGAMAHSLGLQTESLGPIKPPASSLGRTLAREPESATSPNTFPTNASPALQGMSMPLLGSVLGGDGSTPPTVRDFCQPWKGFALPSLASISGRCPVLSRSLFMKLVSTSNYTGCTPESGCF